MVNCYCTPLHLLCFQNLDDFFQKLFGFDYRILPNRFNLRIETLPNADQNSYDSAHIELGNPELAGMFYGLIMGISNLPRPFTYYENTSCNYQIEDYFNSKSDPFVTPSSEFKDKFTRVRVYCPPGHLLVWDHRLMHEVCMEKNFSVYLSPFSNQNTLSHYKALDQLKVSESEQKIHPSIYAKVNTESTDILGSLFQMPGYYYPSRKRTIVYYHRTSTSANRCKFLPQLLGSIDKKDQHGEPMEKGVFYNTTFQERLEIYNECRQLFPKIPEIAYTGKREHILKFIDSGNLHWEKLWSSEKPIDKLDMMRYWINDPRILLKESNQIFAYRFGYIAKL